MNVTLSQKSPYEPTSVRVDTSFENNVEMGGIRIHSLPVLPHFFEYDTNRCYGVKEVFNPNNKAIGAEAPYPGILGCIVISGLRRRLRLRILILKSYFYFVESRTQDMYAVGDLSGKLGYSVKSQFDIFLPLSGQFSVFHRSIVIYR